MRDSFYDPQADQKEEKLKILHRTNHYEKNVIKKDDLEIENDDIDSEMFGALKDDINEKLGLMKQYITQRVNQIAENANSMIDTKLQQFQS